MGAVAAGPKTDATQDWTDRLGSKGGKVIGLTGSCCLLCPAVEKVVMEPEADTEAVAGIGAEA